MLDDHWREKERFGAMAGLGFVLFILPVLAGVVVAALLLLMDRVRFLASFSLCIPLFGATGGWTGLNAGSRLSQGYVLGTSHSWLSAHAFFLAFVIGYCLGIGVGAIAGLGINRLARLVAT